MLSHDTQLLLEGGWTDFDKIEVGDKAVCFDFDNDTFVISKVEEILSHPYKDLAFKIHSEGTSQIVSREHQSLIRIEDRWHKRGIEELPPTVDVPAYAEAKDGSRSVVTVKASVTPVRYEGRVWRVKSAKLDAFVVKRDGRAFVTG